MAICRECGAQVPDASVFCGNCGAEQRRNNNGFAEPNAAYYGGPRAYNQPDYSSYAAPQPSPVHAAAAEADPRPPQGSRYAVIGSWGFFWSLILLNIPVVGWVFTIVWACGGVHNYNLQRLARSFLISWAVSAVIAVLVFVIGGVSFSTIVDLLSGL